MEVVKQYVEKIVANLPINDEERVLMKEEFENHILEHIDELRMVGYSEQQAIQQALQSFGEAHYIEKEMKKVLFPHYKWIRFCAAIIFTTFTLCISAHFISKWLEPRNASPISIGVIVMLLFICTFVFGLWELLYKEAKKAYKTKWLNVTTIFIVPTLLYEFIVYLQFQPDTLEDWLLQDELLIPLYVIFYVVGRQLYTYSIGEKIRG
ncbi:permease prefix domain 1-containing protein [Solibacillus sp. FSL R5-0691]|uniref:permease prefix domain 1-containing protein n=1 Tax=Solibacillus sp. FSL R5-0691 TaxID=2921653 RepID=UPI0030D53F7F